ncbi:hypothetical protein [Nocardia brasiliensis]|uniref:hypothetical protein n=1 Tax=Nocardia brasiliensis TaxID=37326 RepID=UPI00340F8349
MARVRVTLDRAEVGLLLRTAFGDDVAAIAEEVAEHAARSGGRRRNVRVRRYTTDRQVVAVSVPAYRQAKHGDLSKAAAAAGLIVRGTL